MDDAIRKALEVAAQGLEGSAAASQWLAEPEELAAAAIAAFLEALPNEMLDTVPDVGYMDAVACRNAWLAAVRRAAGGG
jgi:hypothetical protein